MCSVFGDGTRSRPRSQSTSDQRSDRCSEGHRNPPNRLNANSNRHWASGQASITLAASSRVMKNFRSGLLQTLDSSSEIVIVGV